MKKFCYAIAIFINLVALSAPCFAQSLVYTIAGGGAVASDGVPATSAVITTAEGVWKDIAGNIYLADRADHRIRKIDAATGIISTIAGTGISGYSGDGGPATAARINSPVGLCADPAGNCYFADRDNHVIRRIDAVTRHITTVAGNGTSFLDGVPATAAAFSNPQGLYLNSTTGDLYFTVSWGELKKVIASTGRIYTVAGSGSPGLFGDGGPATLARLSFDAAGIVMDAAGNIFIADKFNHRVRRVDAATGIISTFAGTTPGYSGDGGPAVACELNNPVGLAFDCVGNLLIGDRGNGLIRRVDALTGIITTVGGGGTSVAEGELVANTAMSPGYIYMDPSSNLYYSDHVLRMATNMGPFALVGGAANICTGNTHALSASTAGGTWTSSNPAVAPVNPASGLVSGNAPGTATISYTAGPGCLALTTVTVIAMPGPITGSPNLCLGIPSTLFNSLPGGTWSSGNPAVAAIDVSTGVVATHSFGTAQITYSSGSFCNSVLTVTVSSVPTVIAGPLSVCSGNSVTFTNSLSGGTWYSANTSVATAVPSSGVVTGTTAGTALIYYVVPGPGCAFASATIRVHQSPAIAGAPSVCELSSVALTELTGVPGLWSGGPSAIALVSASGAVAGISAGVAQITYSSILSACFATHAITVNPVPAPITGSTLVCQGDTVALSDPTPGGHWYAPSGTSLIVTGPSSALFASSASGVAIVTYMMPATGCIATANVYFYPIPAISGTLQVCELSSSSLTVLPFVPGAWASSSPGIAAISAGGLVSGIAAGTAGITFTTATGGCTSVRTFSVQPQPSAITGTLAACQGNTTTLANPTPGGAWSYAGSAGIVSVSPGGVVTGLLPGTAAIRYSMPAGCFAAANVTIFPAPPTSVAVGGPLAFCPGGSVTLSAVPGYAYQWYNGASPVSGATTMSYTTGTSGAFAVLVTAASGCSAMSSATLVSAVSGPVISASGPTAICSGGQVALTASAGAASGIITYQWQRGGVPLPGATSATFNATINGSYNCLVNVSIGTGTCMGSTASSVVTVLPQPIPLIHKSGGVFVTDDHSYATYQWYVNTTAVPGATSWSVVPYYTGSYRLKVADPNGCEGYSTSIYKADASAVNPLATDADISIYPNPVSLTPGGAMLHVMSSLTGFAALLSMEGKVLVSSIPLQEGSNELTLPPVACGLYLFAVYSSTGERVAIERLTVYK